MLDAMTPLNIAGILLLVGAWVIGAHVMRALRRWR